MDNSDVPWWVSFILSWLPLLSVFLVLYIGQRRYQRLVELQTVEVRRMYETLEAILNKIDSRVSDLEEGASRKPRGRST